MDWERIVFQSSSDVSLRTHMDTPSLLVTPNGAFQSSSDVSLRTHGTVCWTPSTWAYTFQSSSDVSLRTHRHDPVATQEAEDTVSIVLRRISSYSHHALTSRRRGHAGVSIVLRRISSYSPTVAGPITWRFAPSVSIVLRRISSYSPLSGRPGRPAHYRVSIVLRRISSYSLKRRVRAAGWRATSFNRPQTYLFVLTLERPKTLTDAVALVSIVLRRISSYSRIGRPHNI